MYVFFVLSTCMFPAAVGLSFLTNQPRLHRATARHSFNAIIFVKLEFKALLIAHIFYHKTLYTHGNLHEVSDAQHLEISKKDFWF